MLALIAALLLTVFPTSSNTSWMQPDAFRLKMGMSKSDARTQLKRVGVNSSEKKKDEIVVAYSDQRTVTLAFRQGRLRSLRFELVDFMPAITKAFDEQRKAMTNLRGMPSHGVRGSVAIWDRTSPNVFVVASIDPASDMGRQGLGMLIVRYFDPATD